MVSRRTHHSEQCIRGHTAGYSCKRWIPSIREQNMYAKVGLALYFRLCLLFVPAMGGSKLCGYESCTPNTAGYINVHIISHSHNDVGWTETAESLYNEYVLDIYNSLTNSLTKNPERKYSAAEMAYFMRWWEEQLPPKKITVRNLIQQGQLQFVGGGWVQNDEATTHYTSMLDQMTLGLTWLNDTFGECGRPLVAWQIDTYGHSREQAAFFAQMGFNGVFLGRVDHEDKAQRQKKRSLEFLWKADRNLGVDADIFSIILPNVYMPPKGFCFDKYSCTTDVDVLPYNSRSKARQFIAAVQEYAKFYNTNNVPVTMGGDLAYTTAESWFSNLDRLIDAANKEATKSGIKLMCYYSSPACYLNAVHNASKSWPVYTEDMFPYADRADHYWTGYYSSRPALKRYIRYSTAFLLACKQLATIGGVRSPFKKFRRAVATAQHHDAITGTSAEKVAQDYAKLLGNDIIQCEKVISDGLENLMWVNPDSTSVALQFCHRLNETICFLTENEDRFIVIAYNSLGRRIKHNFRLPVPYDETYTVTGSANGSYATQIISLVNTVLELPTKTTMTNDLVFQAELPAMGASAFYIQRQTQSTEFRDNYNLFKLELEESFIENEKYRLVVDLSSGLLREVVLLEKSEVLPLRQSFFCYETPPTSSKVTRGTSSGAFVFGPPNNTAYDLGTHVAYRIIKGAIVQEIQQVFTSWITQVIRLYKGQDWIEFEWMIGPIPIESRRYGAVGREVVSRFTSNLQNDGIFFTDSNGRSTVKRRRSRQSFAQSSESFRVTSPNYYPVTSWIYIKDLVRSLQFTVLPDLPEGGSSLQDGEVELMVHRRLVTDDECGLREILNDTSIVKGRHLVHIGQLPWHTLRYEALRLVYSPVLTYTKAAGNGMEGMLTSGNVRRLNTLGIFRSAPGAPTERASPDSGSGATIKGPSSTGELVYRAGRKRPWRQSTLLSYVPPEELCAARHQGN
ncbi:lysosomal alpha-mannosidase-like isoform X2 [Ornithodoros turicata]|uniref:lysosomal alpha-mannosidase-like isoform X2 n=1 Tax=Ornithodoros turicata TaxID=34597 RepID=UPI003138BDC0